MAAKVVWYREAWWLRTRWGGNKKKDKKFGTTKADKKQAEKIAREVNARLALGEFPRGIEKEPELLCGDELAKWHALYSPTMKPSYEKLTAGHIRNHLVPFFGAKPMDSIFEADLLAFIKAKLAEGLRPKTIQNSLSILRRVYSVLQKEGRIVRNPASGIGELMRKVGTRLSTEAPEAEFWETNEIENLIRLARDLEPRFAPLLVLLLSTGMRRGEAMGLQWSDIDFETLSIWIRRSITSCGLTTPKSGRGRVVKVPESLALELFELLATRRVESMHRGWSEVPEWVFCSETGTAPDTGNIDRTWRRLRRKAQALGVRPLRLHAARHTWATRALRAGKSVRWVADQLGHSDPALTLRVYAHAMREEETDLSFAEFGGSKRLYPAPASDAGELESDNPLIPMARREGFDGVGLRPT